MNEQAKVIPLPQYEECESCTNGIRYYPPKYINGDLYHDGEFMECPDCNGTGKIKIQEVNIES